MDELQTDECKNRVALQPQDLENMLRSAHGKKLLYFAKMKQARGLPLEYYPLNYPDGSRGGTRNNKWNRCGPICG